MRGVTRIVWAIGMVSGVFCGNPVRAQTIEQISVPAFAASMPHNDATYRPVASDDGRWVAYLSLASNLVEGDDNGHADVFVVDRSVGSQVLASRSTLQAANGAASDVVGISNDGRYVVFVSQASNLVAGDANGHADFFRKDMQSGAIARIALLGAVFDAGTTSLSGDGNTMVFVDEANDWIAGGTSEARILVVDWSSSGVSALPVTSFAALSERRVELSRNGQCIAYADYAPLKRTRVRNLQTQVEVWGDTATSGAAPDGTTLDFKIDGSCQYLGFISGATNLLAEPTVAGEVYRRNLSIGSIDLISRHAAPAAFNSSSQLLMSANAQHFAYERLADGATPSTWTSWYERRSLVDTYAARADELSFQTHAVTDTGAVIMATEAATLDDLNLLIDVQVSTAAGQPRTVVASALPDLVPSSNGGSFLNGGAGRSEAQGGNLVAFSSLASNLIDNPLELDAAVGVYLRNRLTGTTSNVLAELALQPNGDTFHMDISQDGRYVLVRSCASNLVAGDINGQCDLFLIDRTLGSIELVNVSTAGAQADTEFDAQAAAGVSDDGRFIVFSSWASTLAPGSYEVPQIHVRDRVNHSTRLALPDVPGGLDQVTYLTSLAPRGHFASVLAYASGLGEGCRLVGIDLVTLQRECIGAGTGLPVAANAALSADARFVAYHYYTPSAHIAIIDRQTGTARTISDLWLAPTYIESFSFSGNGRYIGTLTTTATGTQIVGIFDILRETWALPPSVLGSLSPGQMLGYDGTALYFSSNAPLLPTDLNGQVPDVYRVQAAGLGIFGGGWQGGFE